MVAVHRSCIDCYIVLGTLAGNFLLVGENSAKLGVEENFFLDIRFAESFPSIGNLWESFAH